MKFKQSKYNVHIEHQGNKYMFNTFSNGFCKLNDDTYENLIHDTPQNTPFLDMLVREGYAVPAAVDETNKLFVERLSYQYGKGRSMQFLIVPSLKCNLKCIYCYQRDVSYNHSVITSEMVENSIKFIENTLEKNPYANKLKLNWFGGEPLLNFDIIKKYTEHFVKYCETKGIEYSANMTTNGLLLTKDITDYMYATGLKTLQVTIDGTEDFYIAYKKGKPGDLNKLIENVKYAASFFDINVRFNTSAENRESILEIAEILSKSVCMDKVQMYPAKIYGCEGYDTLTCLTDEEFDVFNRVFCEKFKEYDFDVEYSRVSARLSYCGSLRKDYAIIGPDGYLYRCEHQIGKESEIIGDVKYGFYRNEADMKFLNMPYPDECKECNLLPYCFGGCPSDRICEKKKFDCDAFRKKFMSWVIKKHLDSNC